MRCMRLLYNISPNVVVTPVRHGVKEATKMGVKRPSAPIHKVVPRQRPLTHGSVDIRKGMSISELAIDMNMDEDIVFETAKKMDVGFRVTNVSKPIDRVERLRDIAAAFGFKVNYKKKLKTRKTVKQTEKSTVPLPITSPTVEDEYIRPLSAPAKLKPRAPVVTIMGHVDHGKTTLLDALRRSRIVDSEFGGITQHIGAFSVRLSSGARITFLDTPGHAAFSAMRQRGANCTDIVVLVVAADDGVMPQTLESVRFAAEAKVPIIVAINKIDAPNADPENVKAELTYKAGLVLENSGGDVQCIEISALKKRNLDSLQEAIIAQSDVMDLCAEKDGPVQAVVIEAETKKGRGKTATCLVQRGSLKPGAALVAGTAVCRVRAMFNEAGKRLKSAGPSEPVEVMGWTELPETGDVMLEVADEARANEVSLLRKSKIVGEKQEEDYRAYSETMAEYRSRYKAWLTNLNETGMNSNWGRYHLHMSRPERDETDEEDQMPTQNVIIKGDVAGSVEAIVDAIANVQGSQQYELNMVEEGVGEITESDLEIAETFNAIIYVFNVPVSKKTRELAEKAEIEIREFNVIYHLMHDLRDQIQSIIPTVSKEKEIGKATVIKIFMVSPDGKRRKVPVAGCVCDKGKLQHDAFFRVYRPANDPEDVDEDEDDADDLEELIFDGPCESLYRGSQKTKSVPQKSQCGIMLMEKQSLLEDDETDEFSEVVRGALELQPGDRIVCYEIVTEKPEIDMDFDFL